MMSWNKNENTWSIYIAAIEIVLYSLAFCQLQMNLGLLQLHSKSFSFLCVSCSSFYFNFFFRRLLLPYFPISFAVEAIHKAKNVLSSVLSVHNFFKILEPCPINEYAKLKMSWNEFVRWRPLNIFGTIFSIKIRRGRESFAKCNRLQ